MCLEDHVAGAVHDLGIRIACGIIQEMVSGFEGCFGAVDSRHGDVVECVEHGVIDRTGVKKKFSRDFLDEFNGGRR